MTWTPTAENINALPEGLRDYIHRLEASTDPAGMVRENVLLRERVAQLYALVFRPIGFIAHPPGPNSGMLVFDKQTAHASMAVYGEVG